MDVQETEEAGAFHCSLVNQDGTMSWLFTEGNIKKEYDMYYLTYDTATKSFSQRIKVHDDVLDASCYGNSSERMVLYKEGYLYKYWPLENKVEAMAQIEAVGELEDVVVIQDNSFLISYDENGVYIYTRTNE